MGKYLDALGPLEAPGLAADVLQDDAALALLLRLEGEGREVVVKSGKARIRPAVGLTSGDRDLVDRHGPSLAALVAICDEGVQARRAAFEAELTGGTGLPIPSFRLDASVPETVGACVSCGDALHEPRVGRCWRCAVAWRLALGAGVPAGLPELRVANGGAA